MVADIVGTNVGSSKIGLTPFVMSGPLPKGTRCAMHIRIRVACRSLFEVRRNVIQPWATFCRELSCAPRSSRLLKNSETG